ncbi:MAG TPA: AAA domain-containing protein [Fluviicola sp.]|nr:AAA domain-containing protein [Fluviicola sp.]
MSEHHYDIAQFIIDLSEIPSSDPLVHIGEHEKGMIVLPGDLPEVQSFELNTTWNGILKTANQYKREADLQSLCWVSQQIHWEYKGKTVASPLVLTPLNWKIAKGKQQVEIQAAAEQTFVNPFVLNQLIRAFDLKVAENDALSPSEWVETITGLVAEHQIPATFSDFSAIGNFHHHRYQVLRELELIAQSPELSPLVRGILGNETRESSEKIALSPAFLAPADTDQLHVFAQLETGNTVIQGPPGTGKSQVLTNLLGKLLVRDGMTLVVSEKRVALDVLVKKLADAGLDAFTFTAHSQAQPKSFIAQLKNTWLALEADRKPVPPLLQLSEQLKASLQLLLDRLNSPTLVGGVSFRAFRELSPTVDLSKAGFQSDVPDIRTWLNEKPTILKLLEQLGSFVILKGIKQALVNHPQPDQVLRQLSTEAHWLASTFGIATIGELEALAKSTARIQLVTNESYHAYFELHRQPAKRKRFEKLRLRFSELSSRLELLRSEETLWNKPPTRSETLFWIEQTAQKQSWFRRRSWFKQLKAALRNPQIDPQTALANWLLYLDLQEELIAVRAQFSEWGIERPELELESAAYVLKQLEKEDLNELNSVAKLPLARRQLISRNSDRIQQLYNDHRRYFSASETDAVNHFEQFGQASIEKLIGNLELLRALPEVIFRLVSSGKPLDELEAMVLHSNQVLLESRFPDLARFDGEQLADRLREILETETAEFAQFAQHIWQLRKQRFDHYTRLLRTPAAQLKGHDKTLKAQLKTGKSILVKEFGKSKQHLTIRELLSGDARLWIEILSPIWLSTPGQVGKTFPMQTNLFDFVVMDEASQMQLPNALGSLQRSKRAVVAGDEQQMAPSNYFAGSSVAIDLLHQASWYWKKVPLKHHYRSEHPALIAFSNRHFYNNELVAYPTAKSSYPLHWHPVENGIYENRTNSEEAKAVAAFLEDFNWKKSIGIIAFSQQQLDCTWQQLSPKTQERISEGIEKNTVFFKPLEQVQGDEADTIVVSMGYGKNAEGQFQLRFGPLNQSQGFKRLNVLLTRARSDLHFFTSVKAADFPISSNESVNLLRLFLLQLEQDAEEQLLPIPYDLEIKKQVGSTLEIMHIYTRIQNAQELVTFHRVMNARGWKIIY